MRSLTTRGAGLLGPSLLAIAILISATSSAAGLTAQSPSPSYPVEPRTEAGTSPYAAIPKPQECSPARDRRRTADFTPLSTLTARKAQSPFVAARSTTLVIYRNAKGQQFRIYISANSDATVQRYISQASACVEAFPLKKSAPGVIETVYFAGHLLTAAIAETGKSRSALAGLRDQLAKSGGAATLVDVVQKTGGSIDAVVSSASSNADADLAARAAAGELTAAEVAALDVPAIIAELAIEPYAPMLQSSADYAATTDQLGRRLSRNPSDVVIGVEPVTQLPKVAMLWAAFELTRPRRSLSGMTQVQGPLDAGVKHTYNARYRISATSQIRSWTGSDQLKMWRVSDWEDYATSKASDSGPSRKLYASSWPKYRTYDTWVMGLTNGSQYSMYYGWVRTV